MGPGRGTGLQWKGTGLWRWEDKSRDTSRVLNREGHSDGSSTSRCQEARDPCPRPARPCSACAPRPCFLLALQPIQYQGDPVAFSPPCHSPDIFPPLLRLQMAAPGASLVAQWLRIRLPMQGTRVRALIREDPTCRGATKPMRHNYRACALEPARHNY